MCGIYAVFCERAKVSKNSIFGLARAAQARGRDSAGIVFQSGPDLLVKRRDYGAVRLLRETASVTESRFIAGHSRLVTNDVQSNQPVVRDDLIVIHNGIVTNFEKVWGDIEAEPETALDSEIIPALYQHFRLKGASDAEAVASLLEVTEGVVSAILLAPKENKILLISNNGSLYYGFKGKDLYVASEKFPLDSAYAGQIKQVDGCVSFDYEFRFSSINIDDMVSRNRQYLLPQFQFHAAREKMLEFEVPAVARCSACILPETMPFITFNQKGICNYCENYALKNVPKPVEVLEELVAPFRRVNSRDCIVPFSGGRDSCYGLHLIVEELGMNPIAYTYDWGMVTDLGRRNISRMCAKLKVENIIIAADIEKKRANIQKNVSAWLKKPHLGMISLWTAGDKHFFKYVEQVKRQTGISLNLWGVNPMETTHFKTGFLGIAPVFQNKSVYSSGVVSQIEYQFRRYSEYLKNPSYFNTSILDTLSGEYWRSIHKKTDYFHIFDFWRWDENVVNSTLAEYDWEWASDTSTSWRIGDGTAALYNYVYYTVAGFTEHDTFRSNQIREGMITREEALARVVVENRPRYESIQWYLDAIGLEFESAIDVINNIPKIYKYSAK